MPSIDANNDPPISPKTGLLLHPIAEIEGVISTICAIGPNTGLASGGFSTLDVGTLYDSPATMSATASTASLQTLPSDQLRALQWRFADRYDLTMIVQAVRPIARGPVARLVARLVVRVIVRVVVSPYVQVVACANHQCS